MNPDAIATRGRHRAPVLWRQAWTRVNAKKVRHGKIRRADPFRKAIEMASSEIDKILLGPSLLFPPFRQPVFVDPMWLHGEVGPTIVRVR